MSPATKHFACFVAYLCCLLAGCGKPASNTLTVTGAVTFDGQPIPTGDIVLIPADGKTSSDAGHIVDGKFTLQAKPGKKRVEIHATRSGKIDPDMGQSQESYIPARYNSQSALTANVDPAKENSFKFDLTTAPK
jgi:hypothetical protein